MRRTPWTRLLLVALVTAAVALLVLLFARPLAPEQASAIDARRDVAVSAAVAGGGALLLVVAGLVAERWCEIRDRDDDDGPAGTATEGAV